MKYMDLLRRHAIIETYYYTVVLLVAVACSDVLASTWYVAAFLRRDWSRITFYGRSFPTADSVTDERYWLTARHDHSC